MHDIFEDKIDDCLAFDIYADPGQCDDHTALNTVVDCNSPPAATIAAAEILLRRLLQVITDMKIAQTRPSPSHPAREGGVESFGFDSVYSPMTKPMPKLKGQPQTAMVNQSNANVASAAPAKGVLEEAGTDEVKEHGGDSSTSKKLCNDLLHNEYIALDGSAGAEWSEVVDEETLPPPFGLRSPEIDHLLETWTQDSSKVRTLTLLFYIPSVLVCLFQVTHNL